MTVSRLPAIEPADKEDVFVILVVKKTEHYVFVYTQKNRMEVFRAIGRFAADENISFTWYDAAIVSQRLRKGQCDFRIDG